MSGAVRRDYAHEQKARRKLRLLLLLIVLGLGAAGLARGVLVLMQESDKIIVRTTTSQVRAALVADASSRIAQKRQTSLAELQDSNPFEHYGSFSTRYGGVVRERRNRPPPGHWYYDARLRQLVYRVRDPEAFSTQGPFRDEARFHVELVYQDRNGDGLFTPGEDEPQSLELRPSYELRWVE